MRIILGLALAATTLSAMPALAQGPRDRDYRQDVRDDRRDRREDMRDDRRDRREDRRDARQDRRADNRDWRQYRRYDYNRFEPGQRTYYADRYYRSGNYQARALGRNDRIYRGSDNRYYCRRNDGTTGLIVGGLAGGALGNVIAGGGSKLLGTLIGAGGGALLGQSIDKGQVRCR
jgi:Ni/Co efflux regulator RcnB